MSWWLQPRWERELGAKGDASVQGQCLSPLLWAETREELGLESRTEQGSSTLSWLQGASLTWAARRHPCPLTVLGSFKRP